MKTEDLVADLRVCLRGECSACGHECGNADCLDRIMEDAADRLEELVDRCARYAEEIAVLRERGKRAVEDASPYAAAAERQDVGGGVLDRIKELAEADKDGRIAILPCEPGGVMLDMSDLERPEMMKRLHFAVAYVRCGIVFHQPYKIFSENVAAGHIRPVSGLAGKVLGEEDWP